ncbi:MAG: pyridoxal 5'-phosphate synthase glutaminase subunit PdxT [Clostridia bacterium]|nr:pyridoxal 5'-phosphate synthase glutaminase subunit PdxT [Clostridia bacterium]
MKIGVLAVQGAFIEHINMLRKLSEIQSLQPECVEIRQKKDLDGIDGLILPGGESTVQGQLLHKLELFEPIRSLIENGLPVLGTCAGLILLAEELEGDATKHLATLPVTVQRNAYGRQLGSFETNAPVGSFADYPHVFIRAPYITEVKDGAKILSCVDGRIVGVEYGNQIGLAFHPEMTDDVRIHAYFLDKVAAACRPENR